MFVCIRLLAHGAVGGVALLVDVAAVCGPSSRLNGHVQIDAGGGDRRKDAKCEDGQVQHASEHGDDVPLEREVEEGRKDEGKDCGRQTAHERQAELKAGDADRHTPGYQQQEGAQHEHDCPADDSVPEVLWGHRMRRERKHAKQHV